MGFVRGSALVFWAAACALVIGGCSGRSAGPPEPGARDAAEGTAAIGRSSGGAELNEAMLRTLDEAKFAETLRQYRGKVVLADFWATWCRPCVQLFPRTVELHRRFGDRGLAVLSISLDDPENRPQVLKFLAAKGAIHDNVIASRGGSSEAFSLLEIEGGALPHLKLFDRAGKLRKTFPLPETPVDPAEVEKAVKALLDEPAGPG